MSIIDWDDYPDIPCECGFDDVSFPHQHYEQPTKWAYYKNPHNDNWILQSKGHPDIYVSTEHSAKYLVRYLNEEVYKYKI